MPVDESRDRVYIHNLDDEIADAESDEESLVFLPDIEKKLAQLPKSVLGSDNAPASGKEMVLYSVPESISIPKDRDIVRKAMIESRHRAQAKQVQEAEGTRSTHQVAPSTLERQSGSEGCVRTHEVMGAIDDIDAMDLG